MSERGDPGGTVHCTIEGGVAAIVFDRPAARNAMTWPMYEALEAACERIDGDPGVRVATLRGAGGKAFVAGTDIAQFLAFSSADDGIAYEARIDAAIDRLECLRVPTLAIVEGFCLGGGLAIAAACDLRLATPDARFGVPIARTLGNCLSAANTARLVVALGPARTKRLLMLADTLRAEEAAACGFVLEIAEPSMIAARAAEFCRTLAAHAPITMRVAKETVRRLALAGLPDCRDLIRKAYGSRDFQTGVRAFLKKKPAHWRGN